VDTEGLFGGGQSEKIFRSMMVDEYGKAIAQAGGVGIADAVQREILKMQENQQ
jgi:Rod binding domain-containing protein